MICFAVSVFPAPDSPDTRIDWLVCKLVMAENAVSAMANTCGDNSPSARPFVFVWANSVSAEYVCTSGHVYEQTVERTRAEQCTCVVRKRETVRPWDWKGRVVGRRSDECAPYAASNVGAWIWESPSGRTLVLVHHGVVVQVGKALERVDLLFLRVFILGGGEFGTRRLEDERKRRIRGSSKHQAVIRRRRVLSKKYEYSRRRRWRVSELGCTPAGTLTSGTYRD